MQRSLLILLSDLAIVSVCWAESYSLKIVRPEKVGDKAALSSKASDQMDLIATNGGKIVDYKAIYQSGALDAVREVLTVNDKGKPTKLKLTVKSLKYSANKDAEPKEILTDGKVVIATRSGKDASFTIDGKELGDAAIKALKLVVPLGPENSLFDVESLFNTKTPRAVGDDWDAGVDEMIKSMGADMSVQFDPQTSGGKIQLERIEKVNGINCGILTGSVTLVPLSMRGLPEGTDFTDSAYKLTLTCPVPVDPEAPELGGKLVMTTSLKADFPTSNGGKARIHIIDAMSHEESTKPIKRP